MSQVAALLATIAIEGMVITTCLRKDVTKQAQLFAIAITPTLLTHPFLWAASRSLGAILPLYAVIFGLEFLVVIAEGILLRLLIQQPLTRCLLISLVANASSAFFGWLWWSFF